MKANLYIAHRPWSKTVPLFYVANVKPGIHKRGACGDWGYATTLAKACKLTPYEARIFKSDCNRVGVKPTFIPVGAWLHEGEKS